MMSPRLTERPTPEFLDYLEQLSREAESVREMAKEVAKRLTVEHKETLDVVWKDDLKDGGWFSVVCGPRLHKPVDKPEIDLFFASLRALVAAQFGGFSLESKDAIRQIVALEKEKRGLFWRVDPLGAEPVARPFARIFALLSLHLITLPRVAPLMKQDAEKALLEAADAAVRLAETRTDEALSWRVALLKLVVCTCANVTHPDRADRQGNDLVKIARELLHGRSTSNIGLHDKLRDELALCIQYGSAGEYEIADMVSLLGGRYFNQFAQLEPTHAALYRDAVAHVLKAQAPADGSWKVNYRSNPDDFDDPLSNPYAPLAFLLDLPNSVLQKDIRPLIDATSKVLSSLKVTLGTFAFAPIDKPLEVIRAAYEGLMIGAAAAERLKDLLSDLELDSLGAQVPTERYQWDELSNSLGFIENMEKGVLGLWASRSEERPGAILVFGPPGTGKTTLAKALLQQVNDARVSRLGGGAEEDWRFIALSPADFARNGADRVIATAEEVFRKLQRVRRCVVLLDEMEEFLRSRGSELDRDGRLITAAFLPLLQETVSKREIILIVATNFVGTIDPAVTRRGRFDLILPLGPPDRKSRRRLIDGKCEERSPTDRDLLVKYTMGYTRGEIADFVDELDRSSFASATGRELEMGLWLIRQERVPMALSGNVGCNWRAFGDEATRLARTYPGARSSAEGDAYWKEPHLPRA